MRRVKTVGIDIGGTFTDLAALLDSGEVLAAKVLSTPADPSLGAIKALGEAVADFGDVAILVHGTTVATNAILERKGAKTALLTTKGFRDVLELQSQDRRDIWDLFYKKPTPLVPRRFRYELDERVARGGSILKGLLISDLGDVARAMEAEGFEAAAICFLNSYINARHEEVAEGFLKGHFPHLYITSSSKIAPIFREYDRASTAVMNAYVGPTISRYLAGLEYGLRKGGFEGALLIMQSNGGVMPAARSAALAVGTILSGPTAGVLAASHVARAKGIGDFISFDMGGTSSDICLVSDGMPEVARRSEIDGLPVAVPMFRIETVGAGGGSIARMDEGGMLMVGPQSAGAEPGPACYGRGGTKPTITDALLVMGLLKGERFYGGRLRLDLEAAMKALGELSARAGLDQKQLAESIYKIANAKMGRVLRLVSIEKGHDPRGFSLIAFGGAGPLHAASMAEDLGISRVIVPERPGVFSSYGLLCADFRRDYLQTEVKKASELTVEKVKDNLLSLRAKASSELRGISRSGRLNFDYIIDMRYVGQAYEVRLHLPARLGMASIDSLSARFHALHKRLYGFSEPDEEVEIVNYGLSAILQREAPELAEKLVEAEPIIEEGEIYLDGNRLRCRFARRDSLSTGRKFSGPLVIEEPTATTFVPGGWEVIKDSYGNLEITKSR